MKDQPATMDRTGQVETAPARYRHGVTEVESLCEVMVLFGLSKLQVGDVTLERPASLIGAAETKKEQAAEVDDEEALLEKLQKMAPDAIDRALMLTMQT